MGDRDDLTKEGGGEGWKARRWTAKMVVRAGRGRKIFTAGEGKGEEGESGRR